MNANNTYSTSTQIDFYSVGTTISRNMVSIYDYETEENEKKKHIKIINPDYYTQVKQEFDELVRAYFEKDMVEIADGCADLKWVIEGLENTLNLPQQEVWDEVARSNLAKISDDGKVHKRKDGKVLKPKGWTPPDIKSIIKRK